MKNLNSKFVTAFLFCISILPSFAFSEGVHPPGQFVTVNGAKLWYETEGKGEPVLLIAGGPGDSHVFFHPFFSVLSNSYRLIYFDAFGCGKSDRAKVATDYSFDRDVEDIEGLRKALNLGQMNLVGHSYGGMVAIAYSLKYPQSVKRLILSSTLYSGEMWQANNDYMNNEIQNHFPETWEKLQQLRARGVRSSAKEFQELYDWPLFIHFYLYDPSNLEKVTTEEGMSNPDVYFQIAGDDANFQIGGDIAKLDFRSRLKDLRVPVLILAGRFDPASLARFSVQFQKYAPQAKFVMFEKSGHGPFIEEAELYFKTVREFLEK